MAAKRQPRAARAGSSGRKAKAAAISPTQVRIMRAALDLFSERGYAATTTAEIARQARVAEKTLYANFKSKHELFRQTLDPAALELLIPRSVPPVAEQAAPQPGLEELLRSLMKNRIELFRQHPSKFKLIVQEMLLHPELTRPFRDKYRRDVAPFLEQAFERLRKSGDLRDLPQATVERVMASVALGYGVMRFIVAPESDWDDAAEAQAMVSILVDGLRPRPERERS